MAELFRITDLALVPAEPSAEERAEAELVERAKRDPAAFGQLYEIHYRPILNYAYRRVLSIDAAEDIAASTFFKALRGLPKYRPKAPFRAWLFRIATNEIRSYQRSAGRRAAFYAAAIGAEEVARIQFRGDGQESLAQREENLLQYAQLHRSLSSLPERYQTVLVLRFFEDLPLDEIGAVLGKRLGTVKSLIHRGLKRLRRQLEKTQPFRDAGIFISERSGQPASGNTQQEAQDQ